MDYAIILASISLLFSIAALWATSFRRGRLRMTPPSVVYFGPDGGRSLGKPLPEKVFFRALLWSEGARGQVVQQLFISLRRGDANIGFSIWTYGDERQVRGSGFFIPPTGIATNHHFLRQKSQGDGRVFLAGDYTLEVWATTLNNVRTMLWRGSFKIDATQANKAADNQRGVYFDLVPTTGNYEAHIGEKLSDVEDNVPNSILRMLEATAPKGKPDVP